MSTAGSESDGASGSPDPSLDSESGSSAGSITQSSPAARGDWKTRTFPTLHPSLEGHLYSQTSRLGPARSRYEANKGSYKRDFLDPGRSGWIPHSKGAVHGNPSKVDPCVFGFQPPGGARPDLHDFQT
eukprot:TRINITY_DN450_c0_g1_i1.p1 TRINITY_DN450_c0_g1~~TRINITY_DN450_c0_g1_i1.p1  ORF type:complete len:128 (-),score=14.62 TRINITY_DN450_c0_g1_i1:76-459(-)